MTGWPEVALGDAGITLMDCDHKTPPDAGAGYPYAAIPEMREGRLDFSKARRITLQDYEAWTRRALPKEHDIVLSRRCNPGETAYVPRGLEFAVGQNLLLMRSDGTTIEPTFLRWLVRGPEWWEQVGKYINVGAVFDSLRLPDIPRFRIHLPPLAEQRAIAEVLGALDDKIESNERIVRDSLALAEQELRSGLSLRGRSWEQAWPMSTLGDTLVVLEAGSRPAGGVAGITSGVPSIGAESIVTAGVFDYSKVKYVPEGYFARMRRGVLADRDVLLYKDGGTPGNFVPHVSMVGHGFPFERAAINEHVFRLRISPPFSQAYLYFWLCTETAMEEMRQRGTGVAIPGISSANLRTVPIATPPKEVLMGPQNAIESLVSLGLTRAAESRTLASLRDAVLPELLSGRLRVREAQERVEALA